MEDAPSAQGRIAPGANGQGRMQIERVEITPDSDVYNPGDVINIAIYFETPFVGQCEAGLVSTGHPATRDFARKVFSRSSSYLYEGQLYVREADIGARKLLIRLTPVRGEARTEAINDQVLEVRPLVPTRK